MGNSDETSQLKDVPLRAIIRHLDFPRLLFEVVDHRRPITRARVLGSDIEVTLYDQALCEIVELPGEDEDSSSDISGARASISPQ
jgi:hypothetical protein